MRTTLLTGLALLIAGVAVVLVSSGLDLELESTALMGLGIGATLALVPDRTPLLRVAGFAAGFVAAWLGYFMRAGLLPDTAGGRAVAIAVVIALCVAVAAATFNRVPLWATLLGAGALAGGYETIYTAAASEVVTTSVSAVTTVLLTVAVGFLAAGLAGPQPGPAARSRHTRPQDEPTDRLETMMETPR